MLLLGTTRRPFSSFMKDLPVRLNYNVTNDGRKCEKTLTVEKILTSNLTELNFVGRAEESWMPRLECIGWHCVVTNEMLYNV